MFNPNKQQPPEEWRQLYKAANDVATHIGAYGDIDSRHELVSTLMDALHDIDGGSYDSDISNGIAR